MARVDGKTCIITGATSGIGREIAAQLAGLGARLVLVGRDPARGGPTVEEIKRRAPAATVDIYYADLARLDQVRELAVKLAALPRIDVLINNAGGAFMRREFTAYGLERTFALNHMAYFLLTALLRERLVASAPARIINTASDAHRGTTIDFADLNGERRYSGVLAYKRSKLANVLFTRELARRLDGTGVTANCFHPGLVATRIADNNGGLVAFAFGIVKRLRGLSPEQGAATGVYLATSPEVEGKTGGYYEKSAPGRPSRAAQDDAVALRLWQQSARIAGLGE